MHLLARIEHWAEVAPQAIAHRSGGRVLTYGELQHASDIVAACLAERLPPGPSPVAVWGHKEPEMLVAFVGAMKAGHPYIPIDSATPAPRVARIVAAASAGLIVEPAVAAWVNAAGAPADLPVVAYDAERPVYIIFTSGSTGDPKGVMVSQGALESFVEWMLGEHQFGEQQAVFLNQAPFSFDLSVMDLTLALATGSTLFSVQQSDIANPADLYRLLPQSGVTEWVSTPSVAQMCLVEPTFTQAMLPHLRRFLFCGETLPPEVAAALLDRFPAAEVWNTYGPTEATVATTAVKVDRALLARYWTLPVGYPRPDSVVAVVGADGQPAGAGESGEIVIAGPNVALGYVGRPDLTAAAFQEWQGQRAYRTGDWGHYEDGLLFFDGRRDSQIKLHGYRIEIGDIEAHLQRLPGVQGGIVVPKLVEGRAAWLGAFVVLDASHMGTDFEKTQALRRQLAAQLPAYMVPRKFYLLRAFPTTSNGKADRQQLAGMLA